MGKVVTKRSFLAIFINFTQYLVKRRAQVSLDSSIMHNILRTEFQSVQYIVQLTQYLVYVSFFLQYIVLHP